MSAVECLRSLLNERLTAAAEEIFGVFVKTIVEYEEEIDRQRRLLDTVLKPELRLHRTDPPQPSVVEEEVLLGHQHFNQQRNFSLGQEDSGPPQIKEEWEEVCTIHDEEEESLLQEEADTFDLTPTCDGSDHSEHQSLHSDPYQTQSVAAKETPANISFKWAKSESAVPEPDIEHREHQPLLSDPYQTQSVAEKETLANISFKWAKSDREESAVPQPDNDHQLLSYIFPVAESQGYKTSSFGNPGVTRTKPKAFPQRSVLKRDIESTQTQKPFRHGISGKGFTSQHSIAPHLRIHTGEKPYSCTNCGKEFADRSSLKRHLIIHTGDKPYQCLLCGKRFNVMSHLKRHSTSHTGQKPHTCSTCGKCFAQKHGLKEHMMIHTGEKPYTCGFCGRGFTKSSNLKKHMTLHTRDVNV